MASISLTGSLNLNPSSVTASAKQIQQALGRITGQASEFQKSLDASTARVFAFGATTSIINGVTQSLKALVSTTINVQSKLTEINTILGGSTAEFNKFRESIFNVAKSTGQSFDVVAQGAAELARQGLSAGESAKRLEAALILTRISGMDAAASVKALTAAMNGFTSAGLSAEQIVNKIVAVDTAFAVSANDLADGFSRAGSTAEDAGVSFDELLGLITAVEQKTARGGAVIGNAFKSIFSRLSRGSTIDDLKALGVQIDSSQSGVQKLQALARALEQTADPTVSSQIKELAGGVYQINVVSAALKDLSSESSIFANASKTAMSATNEAYTKNSQLNTTIASQLNQLTASVTSFAERLGSVTFAPLLENLIGLATKFSDFLDKALDPEKGNKFIQGMFKFIGNFLSGPGLALFTVAFLKISTLVAKFAVDGFKALMQIGSASERVKNIEAGIVDLLGKDANLRAVLASKTATQAQKEQAIINAIRQENQLLQQQQQILTNIASVAARAGVRGYGGPSGGFSGKGGRRFASGYDPYAAEEAEAMSLGASPSVMAYKTNLKGLGPAIVNTQEDIINIGGKDAVIPRYAKGNVPLGSKDNPIPTSRFSYLIPEIKSGSMDLLSGASGYVLSKGEKPTYFQSGAKVSGLNPNKVKTISDNEENSIESTISNSLFKAAAEWSSNLSPLGTKIDAKRVGLGFNSIAGAKGALQGAVGSAFEVAITKSLGYKAATADGGGDFDFRGGRNASKIQELFNITNTIGDFKNSVSSGNKLSFLKKIRKESSYLPIKDGEIARKKAESDADKRKFNLKTMAGRKERDKFVANRRQRYLSLIKGGRVAGGMSRFAAGHMPRFAAGSAAKPLGGRAAGNLPRFAAGSAAKPLTARYLKELTYQFQFGEKSALEYAKAIRDSAKASGIAGNLAIDVAKTQLRLAKQNSNPSFLKKTRMQFGRVSNDPLGALGRGGSRVAGAVKGGGLRIAGAIKNVNGIGAGMALGVAQTMIEDQSSKLKEAGEDSKAAVVDAVSSATQLASAGAMVAGPMGAAAGAIIGLGKAWWDSSQEVKKAEEQMHENDKAANEQYQRNMDYSKLAYGAAGVSKKEMPLAKLMSNYRNILKESGVEDTMSAVIQKNAEIYRSGTATAEERAQAEKELVKAFEYVGSIYDNGTQIVKLSQEIASFQSKLQKAGGLHVKIAEEMAKKLEKFGFIQQAASTFGANVQGPMAASVQGTIASNQSILAAAQSKSNLVGLQAQLATTTDPSKRAEIEQNIVEASKEFRKQVVDSAIEMENRRMQIQQRLSSLQQEKVNAMASIMSDAITNVSNIYQNKNPIDLDIIKELGGKFQESRSPEERARILTQLNESTLSNAPEALKGEILKMFGATKQEISDVQSKMMFTGGTKDERARLAKVYEESQNKPLTDLQTEEAGLKTEFSSLNTKIQNFGTAFDATEMQKSLRSMTDALMNAGTNMDSFKTATQSLDKMGQNMTNLVATTNEAIKASEKNMEDLRKRITTLETNKDKLTQPQ